MRHALWVCTPLLIAAGSAGAQDPIGALRKRYAKVDVARYTLEVSTSLAKQGKSTHELSVVFVRDQGYRAQGPVELLVHADQGTLWRCANHGLKKHMHMIEEAEREFDDLPDLVIDDALLALLRGHDLPARPKDWAQQGSTLSAKGSLDQEVRYELDSDGLLASYTHDLSGLVTAVRVKRFERLKRAPKGTLSLGKPTPGKSWAELCKRYVVPRLAYTIRVSTRIDGSQLNTRTITGVYSKEQGFRTHLCASGGFQPYSSSLSISDGASVWSSSACTDALKAGPHTCGLRKQAYSADNASYVQFVDDFLLAANLGAQGIEEYSHWAQPWSKHGKRWLHHGEAAGTVREAVFDKRGRLKRLREVELQDTTEVVYEIVRLNEPRKLKDDLFQPNLKIHQPK